MGQIFKIFTWSDFSDIYANGPLSVPLEFFAHFGRPMAENYDSVFLTIMRPNGAFDYRATNMYVRSFWPLHQLDRPQKSATNAGLTHQIWEVKIKPGLIWD